MIKEHLDKGILLKPINGASTEDLELTERYCYTHSKAGAVLIDVRGQKDVIRSALSGIKKAGSNNTHLIASVTPNVEDVHFLKASIQPEKCTGCGECTGVCPHDAILKMDERTVIEIKKCRGCSHCMDSCVYGAIEMIHAQHERRSLQEVVKECLETGVDTIEFHCSGQSADDVYNTLSLVSEDIREINNKGLPISVCIGSLQSSPQNIKDVVSMLVSTLGIGRFFIQADGETMSDTEYGLQALALGDFIKKLYPKVWVIVSGGTTELTWEAARFFGVPINGVGMGLKSLSAIKSNLITQDFYKHDKEAIEAARKLFSPYENRQKNKQVLFKGTAFNTLTIPGGIK